MGVRALAIFRTSVFLLDDGFGYYSSGKGMSKLAYEQLLQSAVNAYIRVCTNHVALSIMCSHLR